MKPIKVAQMGIGHSHGTAILASLLRQPDLFEVMGYCVCEGEDFPAWQKDNSIYTRIPKLTEEEILQDPELDAVIVECAEDLLTKYARMAIEAGLPVHMDKAGSVDHEEFKELFRAASEKQVTLHLGYMYRYNPAVLYALEQVRQGKLGRIYSVEAHMDCLYAQQRRQWLKCFPGGMLYYLGCHLIDLVLLFQGIPEEIIPLSTCTGFDGVTSEDCGMAAFRYPNGVSFVKTSAAEPGGFLRRQLVICGEKGTLEIAPLEKYVEGSRFLISGVKEQDKEIAMEKGWGHEGKYWETEPCDRYDAMMAAFAAMVRGEKTNPYSYEYEVLLHEVLLKATGYETNNGKG